MELSKSTNIKSMNKILRFTFLLSLIFSINSCSGNIDDVIPEITFSESPVLLTHMGQNVNVRVESNMEWSAVSSAAWCILQNESGDEGMSEVYFEVLANTTGKARECAVEFTVGNREKTLLVKQQSNRVSMQVLCGDTTITYTPQTDGIYTISIDVDWIVSDKQSSENASTFIIAKNTSDEPRTGNVVLQYPDNELYIEFVQLACASGTENTVEGMQNDAFALAYKIHLGWNLGNTLEAIGGETAWGNPEVSAGFIAAVKAAGFNAVRIPCAWNQYIDNHSDYTIKNSWLMRVQEVVDYCIENEMYAILNIHWDGGWLEENPVYSKQNAINQKQYALWKQIANHFIDYGEYLLFAGTNEVHANYNTPTTENIEVQQSFNQTFVDAVRSTGGKNAYRNLIVQAYNTNIDYAYDKMSMPSDEAPNRLIAEVHYYDPWDFCGAQSSDNSATFFWGKEAGYTNISGWGQEDHARRQFAKMKSKFVDKGIPVIMGEYGAVNRTASLVSEDEKELHRQSRAYYLKYVTQKMKENGIVPFYWDNGHTGKDGFALFDRNTKTVFDQQALDALIEGAGAGDYPQ